MDRLQPIHPKLTSTIAWGKEEKVNRIQTMENCLHYLVTMAGHHLLCLLNTD